MNIFHTPARPAPSGPPALRRGGFTLLELIAVIGIIALMSAVVVGGFNGIMKAISATSGPDAMRRALNLARQQACVDGEDTYVWVTGINTFAVVRKAGNVSATTSGDRKPSYLQVGGRESTVSAKWIVDNYADLASAEQAFNIDDSSTADEVKNTIKNYTGIKVFDMEDGVMADISVPPWFDSGLDAWVFGVPTGTSGFAEGSDYGWMILPEQTLPKGYVFDGSYDAEGSFKTSYDKKVHFLPEGSVEDGGGEFKMVEVSTKKTHTVKVDGDGKISISST